MWTKWSRQFHVTRYMIHVSVHIKVQVSMLLLFFLLHNFPTKRTTSMWLYLFHLNMWYVRLHQDYWLFHMKMTKKIETENRYMYNVIHSHLTLWIGTQIQRKTKKEENELLSYVNRCVQCSVWEPMGPAFTTSIRVNVRESFRIVHAIQKHLKI